MGKNYQLKQTFTFKDLNGEAVIFRCYTNFGSSYSTSEYACIYKPNGEYFRARDTWINRPWYRFTYENAIRNCIEKAFSKKADADLKAYLLAQLKDYGNAEAKAAEEWLNAFKSRYEKLNPDVKEALKNSDVELTSTEQAEKVIGLAEMLSSLKK